jgi:small subunit ribosomal protein S21
VAGFWKHRAMTAAVLRAGRTRAADER